jgi:hypothetical protein
MRKRIMAHDHRMDDDAAFAAEALRALSPDDAPAGLAARILADFDRIAMRRRTSLLRFLANLLWPGAPLWQPAAALALSLLCGLAVGGLLPASGPTVYVDQQMQISDLATDQDMQGDGS